MCQSQPVVAHRLVQVVDRGHRDVMADEQLDKRRLVVAGNALAQRALYLADMAQALLVAGELPARQLVKIQGAHQSLPDRTGLFA